MTGNADYGYDKEAQEAAAPKVQESCQAVQESAKGSYSQGSAQTSDVWGCESGPDSFRHSTVDMFTEISDLLSKENDLISRFEANMRVTMKEAEGAEWDNQQSLAKVTEMLDKVANSQEAEALARRLEDSHFLQKKEAEDSSSAASAPAPVSGPSEY